MFRIKNSIYWHEMPEYYINYSLDYRSKNEIKQIENKFKNKRILHLACSPQNAKIASFFDHNPMVRIIHNCIKRPDLFVSLTYSDFTIITVGSIQKIKGTDIWTEVAIKACTINESIKFVWCGGDSDKQLFAECKQKVKNASFENRIFFLGHIEDAKFITLGSHIYFSSSRIDSFPLAVLEAMSYGKNIIHYESGGVLEQLGGFGICVENFDIERTVEVILKQYAIFSVDGNSIFNQNIYNRFIENYTPEKFVEKFKNALL
jgi:glycosyltransferase involved in cell wall biosynthesis